MNYYYYGIRKGNHVTYSFTGSSAYCWFSKILLDFKKSNHMYELMETVAKNEFLTQKYEEENGLNDEI